MNLEQALDFLAKNCPTVFEPISKELTDLRGENNSIKESLDNTQKALNEVIFNTMKEEI